MKYQALFSLKNDEKYLRISSAAVVHCALRVNPSPRRSALVLNLKLYGSFACMHAH